MYLKQFLYSNFSKIKMDYDSLNDKFDASC